MNISDRQLEPANQKTVKLYNHQVDAHQFLVTPKPFPKGAIGKYPNSGSYGVGCGALFHEPGLGKTGTTITSMKHLSLRARGQMTTIAIAPIQLLEDVWHEDTKKFAPDFKFVNAYGGKFPDPLNLPDVVAINYEFFHRSENVKRFMAWMRLAPRTRVFGCAVDESSKIKNHASTTAKALMSFRNFFEHRIVMSGTPAPNCPSEYWAQLEFVAPGIFGNWSTFHRTYFQLERNGVPIDMNGIIMSNRAMQELYKRGAEYVITEKKRAELFSIMHPYIHTAAKKDCLDLPLQIEEVRLVDMGRQQKAAYEQMERHLVVEFNEHHIVAQLALTKMIKLREISSGFAYSDEGELVEFECPKVDAMLEILENLGDRQVIIWANFTWEVEKIQSALRAAGKRVCNLYADTGDAGDKLESIREFKEGRAQYVVANMQSAAHGITWTNCAFHVFFSLGYSFELFKQGKNRTDRIGQTIEGVCYILLSRGTVDERILDVVHGKADVQQLVFDLKNKAHGFGKC